MEFIKTGEAIIYTDGSCHPQQKIGAWVAILLIGGHKRLLSASVSDTTHNRMELTAVIEALHYLRENHKGITTLRICSDSQYVIGLTARENKLAALGFTTKKGKELPNADLVKELLNQFRLFTIEFVKIKAHQKKKENAADSPEGYNIEADGLARKLVREAVIAGSSGITDRINTAGSAITPDTTALS